MSVSNLQLILASSSPQRRELLRAAGYGFQVIPSEIAEPDATAFVDPSAYTAHAAWLKARHVAGQVARGLVIAADTVVAQDGQLIGKPADRADAKRILQQLSGTRHEVLTALCLWHRPEDEWTGAVDCTLLEMRRLTSQELEAYLDSCLWVGKAGAYGIQDPDPYVSILDGSYSNVVGLPMELLERLLRQFTDRG